MNDDASESHISMYNWLSRSTVLRNKVSFLNSCLDEIFGNYRINNLSCKVGSTKYHTCDQIEITRNIHFNASKAEGS